MIKLAILPPEKAREKARAKVRAFLLEKRRQELENGIRAPPSKRIPAPAEKPKKKLSKEEQQDLNDLLLAAAKRKDDDKIEKLVDAGADVDVVDDKGNTPLILSALQNNRVGAEVLIEAGADVDLQNREGDTALIVSCKEASAASKLVAGSLICSGANVNLQNKDGQTALMWAAYAGSALLVKDLLRKGADADILDDEMRRAADYADMTLKREVAALLREHLEKKGGKP